MKISLVDDIHVHSSLALVAPNFNLCSVRAPVVRSNFVLPSLPRLFFALACVCACVRACVRACVVNGAEWLGGNSQQVTGDSGLI